MVSDRLSIRRIVLADASFILELLNEEAFLKFIGDKGVRTISDAERYITDGPVASHSEHGYGLDLIELAPDFAPVGIGGLLKRDYLDEPDIGFAVLEKYRREGIALEACNLILEAAYTVHALDRLLAIVNSKNQASVALLRKIGFIYQSEIDVPGSNDPVDVYSCSLNEAGS